MRDATNGLLVTTVTIVDVIHGNVPKVRLLNECKQLAVR
jgi:hypothetical protein